MNKSVNADVLLLGLLVALEGRSWSHRHYRVSSSSQHESSHKISTLTATATSVTTF